MRLLKTSILIFLFSSLQSDAQSISGIQSSPKTLNVLFLGNSYTGVNNLPQLVHDVALSAGDSLVFNSNTPGGYTLDQHFTNTTSLALIQQGGWDYVVLQEQSQLPSFQNYLSSGPANLSLEVSEYNSCARTMFYMTWGRKNGDASNCNVWPPVCTYEGMDSLLRLRYLEMASVNESEVSPVGKVWNRIRQLYPAIDLYQTDESHPSLAGSYAAACCFYSALFKADPTNITYDFSLLPAEAAIIRQMAKEVVFDSLDLYSFIQFNPTALFHYSIGPGTNEIVLANTSSEADSYLWDFGDGDTSTLENPIHSFLNDGNYIVSLTAKDCDIDSVYESVYQLQISFCSHTPVVFPDTVRLCPNNLDTLWTQQYDAYQWVDGDGDSIAGATNRYFVAGMADDYSVFATLNSCSEKSQSAYAESYLNNIVIYNIDTTAIPDTACVGDTLFMILYPSRPAPAFYINNWYQNGVSLNFHGDTLAITAQGIYTVSVENQMCPGYLVFQSTSKTVYFSNCNVSVPEYSASPKFEIFPIPSYDKIFIKQNSEAVYYEIFDIFGRQLLDGIVVDEIDLSTLLPGSYFIAIGSSVMRIIKSQ